MVTNWKRKKSRRRSTKARQNFWRNYSNTRPKNSLPQNKPRTQDMNKNGIVKESTQTKILTASNIKTCQAKRKRRHFKRRYDTEMKVNRKSKPDRFRNSHSCEAEKKFRKGAIKNEKHKIKRITARRGKSRESEKRKKTIHVFPILNWNRWRGCCCPQSENIFRRRRDEKIMPNGKRTRLKKPHYNLIKNQNYIKIYVPLMATESCLTKSARWKVYRNL